MLKQHRQIADMMKQMGGAKRGPMGRMASMLGMGGGMPSADEIAAMQAQMGGAPPSAGAKAPSIPSGLLGGKAPSLPGGLPGLGGGKLPGLGGGALPGKKK